MIESIIEWSIRNRFLRILASLLLGIAGVRAMVKMPVDAIPDLSKNQVIFAVQKRRWAKVHLGLWDRLLGAERRPHQGIPIPRSLSPAGTDDRPEAD